MEDNGEDGAWQLVVHLQTDRSSVTQITTVSERVCVQVCVHLQPVQLGPQAALVQRLFELHLDPRQEVPPHRARKRLTHHHGGSTEVHLTTIDITHSHSAHWTNRSYGQYFKKCS